MSSGSMLTKLTRSLRASRSRSFPNCRKSARGVLDRRSRGLFARGRSTFRIDSGGGDAARRTHLRHIFPSWRHQSSGREHVFPAAFGHAVENFLRPLRYLTLIVVAAFIGDLAHIALDPRSQMPCIGASGGIAGVITFYALNFPRMRLAFMMRRGFVWFRWTRLPACFVFVLWILFQIIGTLEQKAGMSFVSSAARRSASSRGSFGENPTTKPECSNDEIRMKNVCHFVFSI